MNCGFAQGQTVKTQYAHSINVQQIGPRKMPRNTRDRLLFTFTAAVKIYKDIKIYVCSVNTWPVSSPLPVHRGVADEKRELRTVKEQGFYLKRKGCS